MLNDTSYGFESGVGGSSCLRTRNPSQYSLPPLVSLVIVSQAATETGRKECKGDQPIYTPMQPGLDSQRSGKWWLIYSPAVR